MDKQSSKPKQSLNRIKLDESKQIRSVVFLHKGNYISIMCLLEVLIVDLTTGSTIKTIRRLTAPKNIVSISNTIMGILFSDNYCLMYDTDTFQVIYIMIGIPKDHKGIKVSEDGRYILYGNDTAIQVWNMAKSSIEVLSHKFKYVSCYNISSDGSELYLGTFNGEIMHVKLIRMKQFRNNKIPFSKQIKPSNKCLLAVEIIDSTRLITIDFTLSCYVANLCQENVQLLCKLQPVGMLTKPMTCLYSSNSESVYLHVNQQCWRMQMDGGTASLTHTNNMGLARVVDSKKVMLLNFEDNRTFTLQEV